MDTLKGLIHAVVENPQEDTPMSMLADHLLDQGDGRGDILLRWLQSRSKSPFIGSQEAWHIPPRVGYPIGPDHIIPHPVVHSEFNDEGYGIDSEINYSSEGLPGFHIDLSTPEQSHRIGITVSRSDARFIADRLPNAAEVHKFLDTHFGPDPRYNDSLNKALKPETE